MYILTVIMGLAAIYLAVAPRAERSREADLAARILTGTLGFLYGMVALGMLLGVINV